MCEARVQTLFYSSSNQVCRIHFPIGRLSTVELFPSWSQRNNLRSGLERHSTPWQEPLLTENRTFSKLLIQSRALRSGAAFSVLMSVTYAFVGSSLSFAAHLPKAVRFRA